VVIDDTVSLSSEVDDNTLDQLTQSFAAKGLTQEEMVTLSGPHYNFSGGPGPRPPGPRVPRAAAARVDPNLVVPIRSLETRSTTGPYGASLIVSDQRAHRRAGLAERVWRVPVEAKVRLRHGQGGPDRGAHRH
jgi:hypothetical protein